MKLVYLALIALFFAVILIRVNAAFESPTLSLESYGVRDLVESIRSDGFLDTRDHAQLPLFYYLLALASTVISLDLAMVIVPNILASSIVIISYAIATQMTRSVNAALVAALASALVPIFFVEIFLDASVASLALPLFFLAIYAMLRLPDRRFMYVFVLTIIALSFTHPIAPILVLSLWVYLALAKVDGLGVSRAEVEVMIFASVLAFWVALLFYKVQIFELTAFPAVRTLPAELMATKFFALEPLYAIIQVGLIPFLGGLFMMYRAVFRQKYKAAYVLASVVVVTIILLGLNFLESDIGLMILGISLAILFGRYFETLMSYLNKTKAARFRSVIAAALLGSMLISSLAVINTGTLGQLQHAPTPVEISAFEWIRDNARPEDMILAPIEYGHMISSYGKKPVIASGVIYFPDAKERFEDVSAVYDGFSHTDAQSLLDKYQVEYIVFLEPHKGRSIPDFTENSVCFKQVFYQMPIYRVACEVS